MTFYDHQTEYPLPDGGRLIVYRYTEKFSVPFWGADYTRVYKGVENAFQYKRSLMNKPTKRQIQNWIDDLS